jgi:hypothetical protein
MKNDRKNLKNTSRCVESNGLEDPVVLLVSILIIILKETPRAMPYELGVRIMVKVR